MNISPFSLVKVHSKLISSKVIAGLIVFSRAKLISIGSEFEQKHFERINSMNSMKSISEITSMNAKRTFTSRHLTGEERT